MEKFHFSNTVVISDLKRLANQVWKLLPMREHDEDWQRQLTIVLIEFRGLNELFDGDLNFLIIVSTLAGLATELDFKVYRSAIFAALSLITNMINNLDGKS